MSAFQDIMPGGLADAFSPHDFNPEQLKIGIKHELEHTEDSRLAREIAMDHLAEDPMYYQKLKQIEESIKIFVYSFLDEHWDQHLDKVIDQKEFPWDNEEEPEMDDNPLNPYDANNSLDKVKANAHPKTYGSQRAGVKKGSGPPGGGSRFPGGTRQGTSSGY